MTSNNDSTARTTRVIPNLMPCEISSCETTITKQLWTPVVSGKTSDSGLKEVTAYFRGRRLVGKEIDLPDGFTGFVLENKSCQESAAGVETSTSPDLEETDDNDDENQTRPLPKLEPKYSFNQIRILDHEEQPSNDSPHMRAMQEWTTMAAAIHRSK